jgi:hypothetical protein
MERRISTLEARITDLSEWPTAACKDLASCAIDTETLARWGKRHDGGSTGGDAHQRASCTRSRLHLHSAPTPL